MISGSDVSEDIAHMKSYFTRSTTDTSNKPGIAAMKTKEIICHRCGIKGHIASEHRQPRDKIKERHKNNKNNTNPSKQK